MGLLENAFDQTKKIVVKAEEIHEKEPQYLKEAFAGMGKLNFTQCDILVVDEIGKNISGGGADPNITGMTQGGYMSIIHRERLGDQRIDSNAPCA